ncbi:ester cyclase [Chitinophaga sp. CF418]|uniref:ester cyclase n=1 Tax=Chitinophaga sp. CF418 TaxID=1855287 RepID=UPI0009230689|nr:ester cyclase [Chitinophaga sp. CF418]SHN35960.1 Quinol monooxygenase YgiN [Chitinophaga sp. CF418]
MKTAFVSLKAKDQASAAALKSSLLQLQRLSEQEPGIIAYEIFTIEETPLNFRVRESWKDETSYQQHCSTPHLQQFAKDCEKWLETPFTAVILSDVTEENTAQNNAAIIQGLYDAVNKKDLGYISALGADFSEWLDVPFNYTTTGKNAIIDPWVSWFGIFPDATCEVKSLKAFGNTVIAQGIGRGTHKGDFNSPAGLLKPSGVKMEVNFCDVYTLKNGCIERADSYFDFYGLLQQLKNS